MHRSAVFWEALLFFSILDSNADKIRGNPPPPPGRLSECLFFFGVFLSMLARAAGP